MENNANLPTGSAGEGGGKGAVGAVSPETRKENKEPWRVEWPGPARAKGQGDKE